jgi:hypothetical protein
MKVSRVKYLIIVCLMKYSFLVISTLYRCLYLIGLHYRLILPSPLSFVGDARGGRIIHTYCSRLHDCSPSLFMSII